MGMGIWSNALFGMLAFSLPISLGYDPSITVLSLLIAIASSGARAVACGPERVACVAIDLWRCINGAGVVGMHYTGWLRCA